MITDLYKEGGVKEMKKWAYELHSSFLLPGAVSLSFLLLLFKFFIFLKMYSEYLF